MTALEKIKAMADPAHYQGDLYSSRMKLAEDHQFLLKAFKVMREVALHDREHGHRIRWRPELQPEQMTARMLVDEEFETRMEKRMK